MTHTLYKRTAPHDQARIDQARKDVKQRNKEEVERACKRSTLYHTNKALTWMFSAR